MEELKTRILILFMGFLLLSPIMGILESLIILCGIFSCMYFPVVLKNHIDMMRNGKYGLYEKAVLLVNASSFSLVVVLCTIFLLEM